MEALRKFRLTAFVLAAALLVSAPAFAQAKNTFVMISDGTSFGAWDMADLYQYGETAKSPYFGQEFKKYLTTTFPLNTSNTPTGGNVQKVTHVVASAWDSTPNNGSYNGYPHYFNAYDYLRQNYPDSAASATAMATGEKTYNNAINWSNDPAGTGSTIIPTLPELAKQYGKTVGTISSVQWSHATPAGFSNAHNISRNNYAAIANEMLSGNVMDVIMGAGNPDFNNDGLSQTPSEFKYVGGQATWNALKNNTHQGWTSIQSKEEFQQIADGTYNGGKLPDKVVGTAKVISTLQQSRGGFSPTDKPYEDPLNQNVPDLVTMTKAAVKLLDTKTQANGDQGFFLHIEGGAVDWAAHANQTSRIIEEQVDFNNTVKYVIDWIKNNGGPQENLLIITTDHGNAMPMGPDSGTTFMDRIEESDIGKYGNAPKVKWHSDSHTNELVPLFAWGAGAEMFADFFNSTDVDNTFATIYPDWAEKGFETGNSLRTSGISFVDNRFIYDVVAAQIVPTPIPGSFLLMGSGVVGMILIGIRRRRV